MKNASSLWMQTAPKFINLLMTAVSPDTEEKKVQISLKFACKIVK